MTIENTSISDRPGSRTSCCVPRPPRGWSAPVLPANTWVKRRVDHILPRSGLPAVAYFAAVIGLLGLAQALPAPTFLAVDAVAFLAGGTWCALNFWRCRQAHCLLAGFGWLVLALFTAAEAVAGHSMIGGDEQLVFLAVLAVSLVFEAIWYLARHTNAVTPAQSQPASGNLAEQIPHPDSVRRHRRRHRPARPWKAEADAHP